MKKSISVLFVAMLGIMAFGGIAFAQTEVSGLISQDTTWDKAGSPYLVKGNLAIDSNATLFINEGVEVIFTGKYYIQANGTIEARGTANNYIKFNSVNNEKLGSIILKSSNNIFDFCRISNNEKDGIYIASGANNNKILNTIIENSNTDFGEYTTQSGIRLESSSNNEITNCTINNCAYGVYFSWANYNLVTNCEISNNKYTGIFLRGKNNYINQCLIKENGKTGISISYGDSNEVNETIIFRNGLECPYQDIYLGKFYAGLFFTSSKGNIIKDSQICENYNGMTMDYNDNPIIRNKINSNKNNGIYFDSFSGNTVKYSNLENNVTGININYVYGTNGNSVTNNNILNNNLNLISGSSKYFTGSSIDFSNNYWGARDEVQVRNLIIDYYKDFSLAKVDFKPYLLDPYGSDLVTSNYQSGTYSTPLSVNLSVYNGNPIYYSLGGSSPIVNGTLYTQPILVNRTLDIKAVSVKDNVYSEIMTYSYSLDLPEDILPEIYSNNPTIVSDISSTRPTVFSASSNKIVNWSVYVYNSNNELIRTFSLENSNTFSSSWSPSDEYQPSGEYKVKYNAVDLLGQSAKEVTQSVYVYNYPIKISNVRVIDNTGQVVTSFKRGQSYLVEAKIQNLGPNVESPMLIVQVKDSNGVVQNIGVLKFGNFGSGADVILSLGSTLANTALAGDYSIEIMVWTDWQTPKILSEAFVDRATFHVVRDQSTNANVNGVILEKMAIGGKYAIEIQTTDGQQVVYLLNEGLAINGFNVGDAVELALNSDGYVIEVKITTL